MLLGVTLPHHGPLASPEAVRETALGAEALGFDVLGTADHVAMPRKVASLYDLGPSPVAIPEGNLTRTLTPLYEILATMAYAAGLTTRVRLSTGVLVLPLRNPIYNARQIATIDAYSGGRVDLGIGAGWLKEEAEAMQLPWDERGVRTEEHIGVLRTLWTASEPYVSYNGRFYHFDEIDPAPFPAQRPVPILVGGHSPAAKRRAGRIGNGWMTTGLPAEAQAAGMEDVSKAAEAAGRDPQGLLWHGAATARYESGAPKAPDSILGLVRAYRELGVQSMVLQCQARSLADRMTLLEWLAREALPVAHA
ncbi:MAG: TIGR03619 family F420-dependent LLM class oxidoreductase [Caulobacteraceae bacterium]|nr:TIGR03619 family F420-dependent LLM class oxidoreductase [Caulobacteraceae bacterium]